MKKALVAVMLCALMAAPLGAQQGSDDEVWRAFAARLEPNAFVKIRLANGETLRGHVVQADAAALRVNPKTRIAIPLRQLPYTEIRSIERQHEARWNPASKVLLGVGIGLGVLYAFAIAALASGYD